MFKAKETFLFLLHTPLVPPPPGPRSVELQAIDESFLVTPVSPMESPSSSVQSSIELDPSQAAHVRSMVGYDK